MNSCNTDNFLATTIICSLSALNYSRVVYFYSLVPDGNLLIFRYYIFDSKLLVNFKKQNYTKRENEGNTTSTFIGMILSPDNLYDSIEKENGTKIE